MVKTPAINFADSLRVHCWLNFQSAKQTIEQENAQMEDEIIISPFFSIQ